MNKLWFGKHTWLKRIFILLMIAGILGVILILGINFHMKSSVSERVYNENRTIDFEKVDCILVLGAGIRNNGEPSPALKDRLTRSIELYNQGVSDRILMSGDHGRKSYDEVNTMKRYAVNMGVPAEHIFMDHAGFSTYESIYRARDIFQVKTVAIVSQPFHEYRALYIAKSLGLTAYGVSARETNYQSGIGMETRETLARTKEFFNLLIKPKPTYLGEKIPISGDGTTTDD